MLLWPHIQIGLRNLFSVSNDSQTWHFYWLFKVLLKSVTACAHAPELLVDFVLVLRAVASQNQSLFNIRRFNTTIHPRVEHGSAYLVNHGAVSDLTAIKLSSSSIVFNRRIFLILRLLRYPNQVIQDCWFVSELNYFWKISWTNRFK